MPTILVLYPAYGTVSCQRIARYAQEIEGLKLVLADNEPTTSDYDIFDEVMELPPPGYITESFDLLRRWCDKRHPDGIFMQSERALLLGSLLAREFKLKGPTIEAAHLCSNKYLQRVLLSRAGICNPQFSLAENAGDVYRLSRDFGFPLILKCVISTMSRLVTPIWSEEDIDSSVAGMLTALAKSDDVFRLLSFAQVGKVDLACSPMSQFLVESFAEGDMVETDGLVSGDSIFTFGVSEQVQSENPPFFIEGYLLPAECTENRPIEVVSDKIIQTIGLHYSGFSIEFRVRGSEICLIEVNGRLGWDDGFGELFQVRTHRERISQTLQLALDIEPEPLLDKAYCAALAYRSCYYDGIVEDLPTREELWQLERGEIEFGLSTHRGAHFVAPPNPDAYPHVAWALARHPTSSHVAYDMARRSVDGLELSVRHV